jgi:chromate reductase
MTGKTIVTICGSLRKASINRAVMETLPELAPEGMRFLEAPSFAGFPHYNGDLAAESGIPEGVVALGDAVRAADGVIFVSPEYNYSIPGALKNAIDWLSRLPEPPLRMKPVAIQSAAPGMIGGARMQYHLRQTLVFLDATVFTRPEVFVSQAMQKVEGGRLTDQPSRDAVAAQLAAFAEFIDQVS